MDALRDLRRRRGWSQKDLADESGVGQDTISGIESGRHEPRPSTLRKLAEALDVEVADFFREPALPKAEAPRGAGRAEWDRAVRNARLLREHGRGRMEELLTAWRESKEQGKTPDARRRLRVAMGELLQEAYDARSALQENTSTPRLDRIPIPEWDEIVEAERLYLALIEMVVEAGLSIRRGPEVHEVENAA